MKALVYTGTMKTEFRDEPDPDPAAGQVVVKLSHCGICGSDMHAWHGHDERRVPPLILGHEAVGTALSGKHEGNRVAINPLMTCGSCELCVSGKEHLCTNRELIGMRMPGAFAEAVAILERNVTPIPDHLADDQAALAEPLAVCIHAAKLGLQLNPQPGHVSILGGGAIGLLCALVLRDRGIGTIRIAETSEIRRKLLKNALEFDTYDPIVNQYENCSGLVIDCVGSGITRRAASALVQPGGAIIHVGLQDNEPGLDTRRMTLQEIAVAGTYCYTNADFAEALEMLAAGRITRDGWSEIRSLAEGGSGFEDIHNGSALPKIILEI